MNILLNKIETIKESILKNVPAKSIYLFGSHAYGVPTEKSDIDIYLVVPDSVKNHSEIYGKILFDLSLKKIYYIDLLISRESVFNERKTTFNLEEIVSQKGEIIYEAR